MSQQINLINPALIKKKNFLTGVNIGLLYGGFVLMLLVWYGLVDKETSKLMEADRIQAQTLADLALQMEQMTQARMPKTIDPNLVLELQQLGKTAEMQTKILEVMEKGNQQALSVARYMQGLARQSMEGLWLTGFTLTQADHAVTLRGRSLKADLLPNYMNKLGDDPVFKGQMFGGLKIQQPVQPPAPASPSQNTQTNLPAFIEFELRGLDEKKEQAVLGPLMEERKS